MSEAPRKPSEDAWGAARIPRARLQATAAVPLGVLLVAAFVIGRVAEPPGAGGAPGGAVVDDEAARVAAWLDAGARLEAWARANPEAPGELARRIDLHLARSPLGPPSTGGPRGEPAAARRARGEVEAGRAALAGLRAAAEAALARRWGEVAAEARAREAEGAPWAAEQALRRHLAAAGEGGPTAGEALAALAALRARAQARLAEEVAAVGSLVGAGDLEGARARVAAAASWGGPGAVTRLEAALAPGATPAPVAPDPGAAPGGVPSADDDPAAGPALGRVAEALGRCLAGEVVAAPDAAGGWALAVRPALDDPHATDDWLEADRAIGGAVGLRELRALGPTAWTTAPPPGAAAAGGALATAGWTRRRLAVPWRSDRPLAVEARGPGPALALGLGVVEGRGVLVAVGPPPAPALERLGRPAPGLEAALARAQARGPGLSAWRERGLLDLHDLGAAPRAAGGPVSLALELTPAPGGHRLAVALDGEVVARADVVLDVGPLWVSLPGLGRPTAWAALEVRGAPVAEAGAAAVDIAGGGAPAAEAATAGDDAAARAAWRDWLARWRPAIDLRDP